MGTLMARRVLRMLVLCVALVTATALSAAPAATNMPPMIVVGGAAWCPFCQGLKQRLATDPEVQPLVRHFAVSFVDIDGKALAAAFEQRFKLEQISLPTLVIAAPDGTPVAVYYGAPQGKDLVRAIDKAWRKLGGDAGSSNVAGADKRHGVAGGPESKQAGKKSVAAHTDERLATLREARVLLRHNKIEAAVKKVVPYAGTTQADGSLGSFIRDLEKDGRQANAAAKGHLEQEDEGLVGAVALVKAKRLYGPLPVLKKPFEAAFDALAKLSDGKVMLRQANAIDKGRALDESGQQKPAIKAYQVVIADFSNTQAARMAAARIKQLQP